MYIYTAEDRLHASSAQPLGKCWRTVPSAALLVDQAEVERGSKLTRGRACGFLFSLPRLDVGFFFNVGENDC